MEAADTLYGVSMGDDGVSKVVSRKLPKEYVADAEAAQPVGAGEASARSRWRCAAWFGVSGEEALSSGVIGSA